MTGPGRADALTGPAPAAGGATTPRVRTAH